MEQKFCVLIITTTQFFHLLRSYSDNKVFVSLGSGNIVVYVRNQSKGVYNNNNTVLADIVHFIF